MSERNLLEETIEVILLNEKTVEEVEWVGTYNGEKAVSWKGFVNLAKDCNYDAGFGGQEIYSGLVVVAKDWWLERHEYDGSEWWEFKELPKAVVNPGRLYTVLLHDFDEAHSISNPVRDQFEEWKESASEEELKGLTYDGTSKEI